MYHRRKQKNKRVRIYFFAVIVLIAFVLNTVRLMQFQIVNGEEFKDKAEKSSTSAVTVTAARGEIVDRYGRPLAVNKVGFNIVFDKAFMEEGSENEIIYKLIQLLKDSDTEWIDTLPITKTKPYEFKSSSSEADQNRAKTTLSLNTYATADNCIDEIITKCEINGYDEETTRLIAGVRYEMIRTGFSLNNQYTFAEDISSELVSKLKETNFDYPGVDVVEESIRDYVSKDIAPHIIGTIGPIYAEEYAELKEKGYRLNDVVGKSGIESAFEEYLRGTDGKRQIVQNIKGEVVDVYDKVEAVPGNTVMLTIDKVFQKRVQEILEAQVKSDGNHSGALVVLDAKTGEVLACATYPSYDINEYTKKYDKLAKDEKMPLLNRALFGEYRPGSTYKTSVATSALIEGVIGKGSCVTCRKVYTYYSPSFTPRCTGYHGSISVVTALKYSCNVFFYDVGRRLGIDKINSYSKKMGLGADTGLEIAHSNGALASPERSAQFGAEWYVGNVCQASIGQSDNAVTPLQMASQAMTIANKGVRYDTHIIKSIQSYNYDKMIKETTPVVGDEIENKNNAFEIVTEGMEAVSSRYPDLCKYSFKVAMKTGTPQTSLTAFHSAAVAFAPSDDADIAIGCYIQSGNMSRLMVSKVIDAYYKSKKHTKQKPQEYGELLA